MAHAPDEELAHVLRPHQAAPRGAPVSLTPEIGGAHIFGLHDSNLNISDSLLELLLPLLRLEPRAGLPRAAGDAHGVLRPVVQFVVAS